MQKPINKITARYDTDKRDTTSNGSAQISGPCFHDVSNPFGELAHIDRGSSKMTRIQCGEF